MSMRNWKGPVVGGSDAVGLRVEGTVQDKKMQVAAPRHDRVPQLRSGTSLFEVPSDQKHY
jgi:hypothetical protein